MCGMLLDGHHHHHHHHRITSETILSKDVRRKEQTGVDILAKCSELKYRTWQHKYKALVGYYDIRKAKFYSNIFHFVFVFVNRI